jgi:hypothetical protein
MGHAALYHDGWLASERVSDTGEAGASQPAADAPWQLYDLTHDPSQTQDVAAANPAKLAELRSLFQSEGERNRVLPLHPNGLEALLPGIRPELVKAGSYTYYPSDFRYPEGAFPSINNRSWSIDADLDVPDGGGNGMLVTQGGGFGGWGLVMLKSVPTFLYRATDRDSTLFRLAAGAPLAPGHHHVTVGFLVDGPGFAKGGAYVMRIDGRTAATGHVDRTVPFKFTPEDAAIGHDTGTPLTADYRVPFAYDGGLRSVTFTLETPLPVPPPPAKKD